MRTAITEENSPAWNPGLRIVQLDLARKMETPVFVKGYIDRVAAVGYDAVPCWWLKPDNARSFMAYARRHKVFGCCQTQWEGFFHGSALPNAVSSVTVGLRMEMP